jgi:hypothetical protein
MARVSIPSKQGSEKIIRLNEEGFCEFTTTAILRGNAKEDVVGHSFLVGESTEVTRSGKVYEMRNVGIEYRDGSICALLMVSDVVIFNDETLKKLGPKAIFNARSLARKLYRSRTKGKRIRHETKSDEMLSEEKDDFELVNYLSSDNNEASHCQLDTREANHSHENRYYLSSYDCESEDSSSSCVDTRDIIVAKSRNHNYGINHVKIGIRKDRYNDIASKIERDYPNILMSREFKTRDNHVLLSASTGIQDFPKTREGFERLYARKNLYFNPDTTDFTRPGSLYSLLCQSEEDLLTTSILRIKLKRPVDSEVNSPYSLDVTIEKYGIDGYH